MIKLSLTILLVSVCLSSASVTYGGLLKCDSSILGGLFGGGFEKQHGKITLSLDDGTQGVYDDEDERNPTLDDYYYYDIQEGSLITFMFNDSPTSEVKFIEHVKVGYMDSNGNEEANIQIKYIEIMGPNPMIPEQIIYKKFCPSKDRLFHGKMDHFIPC